MSRRVVLALALSLALPATAAAQFTTFVAPPRAKSDSVERPRTVAAADSVARARADSAERVSLTNMKQWVDSAAIAAGSRIPPTATVDGAGGEVVASTAARSSQTAFRNGATAPNTATPLPLLLVAGAGAVATGLRLLRRRS